MKAVISVLVVTLLVFAYTQIIGEDIPPANFVPTETHSKAPAPSNEYNQTPASRSLQTDHKSTQNVDAISAIDEVIEYPDPHTQQINHAYDALDAEIKQLFEFVDVETLDLRECRYLHEKAWNLERNLELSVLLGDDTISFKNYRDYDLAHLQELALLNDLAAQKMLGFKLMRSLQTLGEGIYWSKVAAARGSKYAIVDIIHAYMNDLSVTPDSKETTEAPDFEENMRFM